LALRTQVNSSFSKFERRQGPKYRLMAQRVFAVATLIENMERHFKISFIHGTWLSRRRKVSDQLVQLLSHRTVREVICLVRCLSHVRPIERIQASLRTRALGILEESLARRICAVTADIRDPHFAMSHYSCRLGGKLQPLPFEFRSGMHCWDEASA
jgi:hypothetical protein